MLRAGQVVSLIVVLPCVAAAQAPTLQDLPPGSKLVPIVEPGKPMRFQVVTPGGPTEPGATEPCALDSPLDRRSTPSSVCMKCHDGSRAGNASTGHRYDVEYVWFGKERRQDPETFNPKVTLSSGMVTCLSCHQPMSTEPYRLAAPVGGALDKRLCTACHIR